jgi:release factor glutamine methyltransferase
LRAGGAGPLPRSATMVTVHQRVADARERLRQAGIAQAEADLDARVLAQHLLSWDAAQFFASAQEQEPAGFARQYEAAIARRVSREPIAYVVGHREFWGLEFEVSPAVLVPRPETELIVEVALELLPAQSDAGLIVDACTGSGCIAIALAVERPNLHVIATDVADAALAVARRNAERHDVADRVEFVRGDLLDPVGRVCELIVSNPPYIAERDRASLPPEVRDYEPPVALFAGNDGLEVIKRLVADAPPRLRPGGHLVFEFGFGQGEAVNGLLAAAADFTAVQLRRDLQGIERTAVATRR